MLFLPFLFILIFILLALCKLLHPLIHPLHPLNPSSLLPPPIHPSPPLLHPLLPLHPSFLSPPLHLPPSPPLHPPSLLPLQPSSFSSSSALFVSSSSSAFSSYISSAHSSSSSSITVFPRLRLLFHHPNWHNSLVDFTGAVNNRCHSLFSLLLISSVVEVNNPIRLSNVSELVH